MCTCEMRKQDVQRDETNVYLRTRTVHTCDTYVHHEIRGKFLLVTME
jgi:hypothetical protein